MLLLVSGYLAVWLSLSPPPFSPSSLFISTPLSIPCLSFIVKSLFKKLSCFLLPFTIMDYYLLHSFIHWFHSSWICGFFLRFFCHTLFCDLSYLTHFPPPLTSLSSHTFFLTLSCLTLFYLTISLSHSLFSKTLKKIVMCPGCSNLVSCLSIMLFVLPNSWVIEWHNSHIQLSGKSVYVSFKHQLELEDLYLFSDEIVSSVFHKSCLLDYRTSKFKRVVK